VSLSTVGLLVFWILLLIGAEAFEHALKLFMENGIWIAALSGGFGLQVALFTFIKARLGCKDRKQVAEVAISGSVSAGTKLGLLCLKTISETNSSLLSG
jgi:hypothetical protein